MSGLVKIKFKNRSTEKNKTDREIARKRGKYNVDVISSDYKKVSANRFVLSMYSKEFADDLADMHREGYWITTVDFTFDILEPIIDLLYAGEITVPRDFQSKITKALKELKITGTEVVDLDKEQLKKPVNAQKRPNEAGQQKNVAVKQGQNGIQPNKNQMGKGQRAQSPLIQGSPRDDLRIAKKVVTPIVKDNQSSGPSSSGVNPSKVVWSSSGAVRDATPRKPQNVATVQTPNKLISNGQSQHQSRPIQRAAPSTSSPIDEDKKIFGGIKLPAHMSFKKVARSVNGGDAAQNQNAKPLPLNPQNGAMVQTPQKLVANGQLQQQLRPVQRVAPVKEPEPSTSSSISTKVTGTNDGMKFVGGLKIPAYLNIKKVVRSVNGAQSPPDTPQNALVSTPEELDLHENGQLVQQPVEQEPPVREVAQAKESPKEEAEEVQSNGSIGDEQVMEFWQVEADGDLTPVPMDIDDTIHSDRYAIEGQDDGIDGAAE